MSKPIMAYKDTLHGIELIVYDHEGSRTPHYVAKEFKERNPFTAIPDNPKVIVDIGANIGLYSFWCAKRWPEATIYAIEPHPDNLKHLLLGIGENGLENIVVLPVAITAADNVGIVRLRMDNTNSGSASQFIGSFRGADPEITFSEKLAVSVSLNHLFDSPEFRWPVDHMKVDTEGGEFYMFNGFSHWYRIKSMSIETHPFHVALNQEELMAKLKAFVGMITDNMPPQSVHFAMPDEVLEEVRKQEWWKGPTRLSHE